MNAIVIFYAGPMAPDYTIHQIKSFLGTQGYNNVRVTSYDQDALTTLLTKDSQHDNTIPESDTSKQDSAFVVIGTMFKEELKTFNSSSTPFVTKLVTTLLSLKTKTYITAEMHALLVAINTISSTVLVYDEEVANEYGVTPAVLDCIKEIGDAFRDLIVEKLK